MLFILYLLVNLCINPDHLGSKAEHSFGQRSCILAYRGLILILMRIHSARSHCDRDLTGGFGIMKVEDGRLRVDETAYVVETTYGFSPR